MNKRQRKKKILNGLSTEERYRRTHCPICKEKIGVFDEYFNTYDFCSVDCAMNTMVFQDLDYKKSQQGG